MRANETVTIRDTLTGTDLKDALSHEGSHVADAQAFVNALTPASADYTKNLTKYQTELRAYMVTNSVLSSANEKHAYDCGLGQTCELGAGARDVAGSLRGRPTMSHRKIKARDCIRHSLRLHQRQLYRIRLGRKVSC